MFIFKMMTRFIYFFLFSYINNNLILEKNSLSLSLLTFIYVKYSTEQIILIIFLLEIPKFMT